MRDGEGEGGIRAKEGCEGEANMVSTNVCVCVRVCVSSVSFTLSLPLSLSL